MSPMSGPDFIARIRDNITFSQLAVVLTTANHQWIAEIVNSGAISGADIYFLKPFSARILAKKLAATFPAGELTAI
jgi:DNA-binding response OmpR family regulator